MFSSFLFAIKQKIHVSTSFTSEFDQLVAVSSMLPEDGLSVAFPEHFPKIFYDVQSVTQCFSENSALLINIVEMKAVGQALLSSLISTADSQGPDSILFHFESVRNIIILSIYLGYVLSKEPSKPCKLRIFNSKLFDYFSAVSLH